MLRFENFETPMGKEILLHTGIGSPRRKIWFDINLIRYKNNTTSEKKLLIIKTSFGLAVGASIVIIKTSVSKRGIGIVNHIEVGHAC